MSWRNGKGGWTVQHSALSLTSWLVLFEGKSVALFLEKPRAEQYARFRYGRHQANAKIREKRVFDKRHRIAHGEGRHSAYHIGCPSCMDEF